MLSCGRMTASSSLDCSPPSNAAGWRISSLYSIPTSRITHHHILRSQWLAISPQRRCVHQQRTKSTHCKSQRPMQESNLVIPLLSAPDNGYCPFHSVLAQTNPSSHNIATKDI